jgi:XTP/dITP diphosphohydrolase
MKLLLASNNAKKLAELSGLLQEAALPIEWVSAASLGLDEPDEPHRSFIENALAKARHAAKASGLPTLADDSGLCVDALSGLPGVDSAHIAPVDAALLASAGDREQRRRLQDQANNAWLLRQLHGQQDRRAHYLCVLVAVRHADDPEPLMAFGRWQGQVLLAAEGEGGFGYDPLMRIDGQAISVAAMPWADKQRLSHRALAARDLAPLLRQVWRLAPCSNGSPKESLKESPGD